MTWADDSDLAIARWLQPPDKYGQADPSDLVSLKDAVLVAVGELVLPDVRVRDWLWRQHRRDAAVPAAVVANALAVGLGVAEERPHVRPRLLQIERDRAAQPGLYEGRTVILLTRFVLCGESL